MARFESEPHNTRAQQYSSDSTIPDQWSQYIIYKKKHTEKIFVTYTYKIIMRGRRNQTLELKK